MDNDKQIFHTFAAPSKNTSQRTEMDDYHAENMTE